MFVLFCFGYDNNNYTEHWLELFSYIMQGWLTETKTIS